VVVVVVLAAVMLMQERLSVAQEQWDKVMLVAQHKVAVVMVLTLVGEVEVVVLVL
jgi:hypothetical protein